MTLAAKRNIGLVVLTMLPILGCAPASHTADPSSYVERVLQVADRQSTVDANATYLMTTIIPLRSGIWDTCTRS